MAIKKDKRRREEEEEEERRGPVAPVPPAPPAPSQGAEKATQSLVPPGAQEKLEQEQDVATKPVTEPEAKNLHERNDRIESQEPNVAASGASALAARQSANKPQASTAPNTSGSNAAGKTPPPPPPRAKRPPAPQAPARRGNFHQKLAKLQELDNAGSPKKDTDNKQQLTRLQAIAENVKHIVKARMGTENPLEVESRTDVKRMVKVAQTNKGEKLVINTDVYIPGRWFRRKQWRTLDQNDEDEFFLKSAGTLANKK